MDVVRFEDLPKLGFGIMRLPKLDEKTVDYDQFVVMLDKCIAAGVNYFDTAYVYHGGESEGFLKRALVERYDRNSFYLADKMPIWDVKEEADLEKFFQKQLDRCGVTYFDFYLIHCLDANNYPKAVNSNAFAYIKKLQQEGRAKRVGFSFHGNAQLLEEILSKHPEVEFVQLQINYLDWNGIGAGEFYEIARRHNKEIIIMEPVKGGQLANLPKAADAEFKNVNPDVSAASWAIRYCMSLPGVPIVLSGMSNIEQTEDNLKTFQNFTPISEEEKAVIEKVTEIIIKDKIIPCTECKYCSECPQEINISENFMLYNRMVRGDIYPLEAREAFGNISGTPSNKCTSCALCSGQCPQHIDIPEQLRKVYKTFRPQG